MVIIIIFYFFALQIASELEKYPRIIYILI